MIEQNKRVFKIYLIEIIKTTNMSSIYPRLLTYFNLLEFKFVVLLKNTYLEVTLTIFEHRLRKKYLNNSFSLFSILGDDLHT